MLTPQSTRLVLPEQHTRVLLQVVLVHEHTLAPGAGERTRGHQHNIAPCPPNTLGNSSTVKSLRIAANTPATPTAPNQRHTPTRTTN